MLCPVVEDRVHNLGQGEDRALLASAAGKDLQEKLEILLEDKDTEQGLKRNWNDVEDAVTMLAK